MKIRLILAFKMIIGFLLGMLIAQLFNLNFAYTAGVIVVLSLEPTRIKSLNIALKRLAASFLGLIMSVAIFWLLGYSIWTILLFLVLFVPLTFVLKIEGGIVVTLVLVSQLYLEANYANAINATFILLIGVGVSFILNLYMPKMDKHIYLYMNRIDKEINAAIQNLANNNSIDFNSLDKTMIEAKRRLSYDIENHYFFRTDQRQCYLQMREQQIEILRTITPILHGVKDISEKQQILNYLKEFDGQIGEANYATALKEKLDVLFEYYRKSNLPVTRDEFESRAQLYYVLLEMDRFLKLKLDYHNQACVIKKPLN